MPHVNHITTRYIIENADAIFHNMRWCGGVVWCPYCHSFEISYYDGYRYRCKNCGNRFTDRTKTVMHYSKLKTCIWMQAAYEIVSDNFISSNVLANKLGVTQKTAWLLQSKLRYNIQIDGYKLTGNISQDEAYLGGSLSNFHYGRKQELLRRNGLMGKDDKRYTKSALYALNSLLKTPVFGMTDGDKVVLYQMPNPIKSEYMHLIFRKHVEGSSVCISDESKLYKDWEEITGCKIYTNNHHNNQYKTKNGLSSNAIENRFSRLKSGYGSRITHSKHTQLYLNEFCFRMNTRNVQLQDKLKLLVDVMCAGVVTHKMIKAYDPLAIFGKIERKRRRIYTYEDIKNMFQRCGKIVSEIKIGKTVYYAEDFI